MSQSIQVNGQTINYPQTGDTNWGDEATDFAVQTSSALAKVGLSTGTTVDLPGTLDVTGNTTLDANLSVGGDASVTGNTTIAGTLGVSGNTTIDGVTYLDDDTTANTPVLSFTGDTNTGIGRSAADTLDFITNGNSRFRIEPTGQIKAVYESQVGTDYNTQLDNGYLCRAWVNFNGTGTVAIRASGNVSSITDNGTGDYTVNFTTAMPDANYSTLITGSQQSDQPQSFGINVRHLPTYAYNVNNVRFVSQITNSAAPNGVYADTELLSLGIFR